MILQNHSSEEKNRSIYKRRILALQNLLSTWNVQACMVESKEDLYYLTGLELSLGRLLVGAHDVILLVDGRYFTICKEANIVGVEPLTDENANRFFSSQGIQKVAFDAGKTSVFEYEKIKKQLSVFLEPRSSLLQALRSCKDESELELMRKSAKLNWKGFLHICEILREGITEKQVAWEYESFVREQGGEGLAFSPIIAFGPNGAKPHHHCTDAKLKNGDAVLIDIGVTLEKYQSDMTRVVFFGEGSSEIKRMYEIVQKSQKSALQLCKPGTPIGALDKAAREVMRKEEVEPLFLHSLGHGIGLETHEYPRIRDSGEHKDVLLEEGMVITIEPGLYIPGVGGVRYEDTVIITKSGFENLYS
jgi:Xaa-Pro aminopeptidase